MRRILAPRSGNPVFRTVVAYAPMHRRVVLAFAALVPGALPLAAASAPAPAPAPAAGAYVLSLDPNLSLETGADLTDSLSTALGRIEARAFARLDAGGAGGVSLRLARVVLLDAPVAWWIGVAQHEVFGHGGRAREFGERASYRLASPWSGRRSYATFTTGGLATEDLLRVYAGGTESNGAAATRIARDAVSGRRFGPMTLLLAAAHRLVASDYVLRTTPDPARDPSRFFREWSGGGDVANYLGYLSELRTGSPGIAPDGASEVVRTTFERMERHAVWNALDPGTWLALVSVARFLGDGDEDRAIPLPRVAGHPLLPILSSDWLPDGPVASLEIVWGAREGEPRWNSVVARLGAGPGGRFVHAGAASSRLASVRGVELGGDVELWTRPGRGLGGGARVRVAGEARPGTGWFVEAGAKSSGHWPGRPAGTGPMVRAGIRIEERH